MGVALLPGATNRRARPESGQLETRVDQSRRERYELLFRRREWLFGLFVHVVVYLEQACSGHAPDDFSHLVRSVGVERDEPVEAGSVLEQELFCVRLSVQGKRDLRCASVSAEINEA